MEKTRNILKVGSRRLGKENWKFYDKTGNLAFINNEHKVKWYLRKKLVTVIGQYEVQFKNEIKYRPNLDTFLITPIERRCVVCGREDNLQKHHVIPSLYRRYMPDEYKSNNHHDVVLICSDHHEYYERHHSNKYRDVLAKMFDVPTVDELIASKTKIIRNHRVVMNKALSILRYHELMKIDKIVKLCEDIIKKSPILKNRKIELLTEHDLKRVVRSHRKALKALEVELDNYIGLNHAKPIVQAVMKQNLFYEFIVDWRLDFVENMKPKFLPNGWDVNKMIPYEENLKN